MDLRETVRSGYDEIAETYLERRRAEGPELEVAHDLADDLPDGSRILDAGCGSGYPITDAVATRHDVVGLDISREQLTLARENVPDAGLLEGDLANLPFTNATFDAVVCYQAIIHVPKDEHDDVLSEFYRVLRPDGDLGITMGTAPFEDTNDDWLDTGETMGWSIHGPETNRELVRDAGFDIDTIESVDDELGGRWDVYRASA